MTDIRRMDLGVVESYDPDTGETTRHRGLFVEATGTDGLVYGWTVSCAPDVPELVVCRAWWPLEMSLADEMRKAGAWSGELPVEAMPTEEKEQQ